MPPAWDSYTSSGYGTHSDAGASNEDSQLRSSTTYETASDAQMNPQNEPDYASANPSPKRRRLLDPVYTNPHAARNDAGQTQRQAWPSLPPPVLSSAAAAQVGYTYPASSDCTTSTRDLYNAHAQTLYARAEPHGPSLLSTPYQTPPIPLPPTYAMFPLDQGIRHDSAYHTPLPISPYNTLVPATGEPSPYRTAPQPQHQRQPPTARMTPIGAYNDLNGNYGSAPVAASAPAQTRRGPMFPSIADAMRQPPRASYVERSDSITMFPMFPPLAEKVTPTPPSTLLARPSAVVRDAFSPEEGSSPWALR